MDIFHVIFEKNDNCTFWSIYYTSDFQACKSSTRSISTVFQLEMCHCHRDSKNDQKSHFQKWAATKTTHWPQKLHHLQTTKSCHKRSMQQSNFQQISQPWRHLKPLDSLAWRSLQCRTVSSALNCKHYLSLTVIWNSTYIKFSINWLLIN